MATSFRAAAIAAALGIPAFALSAAVAADSNAPRFTAEQAALGADIYRERCMSCHGAKLDDGEFAPPLKGPNFFDHWGGRGLDALVMKVTNTMPPGGANSMDPELYLQVVAYMLQQNGFSAGPLPLPAGNVALATFRLPGEARSQGNAPPEPALPAPPAILSALTPVTDTMLRAPPPGDWLQWRRTYDTTGFSPLKQIDRRSVRNLRTVWSWSLAAGAMEGTPLVHDGVLFMQSGGNTFQAFDAASGDLLWQYARSSPPDLKNNASVNGPKRNMAIAGELLIAATRDAHVIAMDIRSGKLVWDNPLVDYKAGWFFTGGPLVVKDRVIQGTVSGNARQPGGAAIVGLELATGKEVWRFNTVAHQGQPGGDSWNDLPDERRSGGSVWITGSYDADIGLAFFGVGQTYDTAPLMKRLDRPGVSNDALYTDSTVALDPQTGRLVWNYQHLANDQWDLDWSFERPIVTLDLGRGPRRYVLGTGKMDLVDVLDAQSGAYAFSYDFGLQNVVSKVDPVTGAKTINPAVVLGDGKNHVVCGFVRNWPAAAVDPGRRINFVTLDDYCIDIVPVAPGSQGILSSGVGFNRLPMPGGDGRVGRLAAYDLKTRKVLWTERNRSPGASPVLATEGGLIFHGSADRWFTANDAANGKPLWRTRLNDVPTGFPITYAVKGKQYVAIAVGNGAPYVQGTLTMTPEIRSPYPSGPALWVFALP